MTDVQRDPAVRGKTIRLKWTDGPTKGSTHEHVFHEDGTVEWRDIPAAAKAPDSPKKAGQAKERPEYAAIKVADNVYAVSYLAASGYTLSVVLNFRAHSMAGFASSSKDWHVVGGTFEVMQ